MCKNYFYSLQNKGIILDKNGRSYHGDITLLTFTIVAIIINGLLDGSLTCYLCNVSELRLMGVAFSNMQLIYK